MQLRTFKIGFPHLCNSQPDPDLVRWNPKLFDEAEPDQDLKIIQIWIRILALDSKSV
jgi:hypothetical protein